MVPRISVTYKTHEAIIDENGQVRLLQPVTGVRPARALVVVLEGEEPSTDAELPQTVLSTEGPAEPAKLTWESRYRRLRDMGSGGMGTVLLAERISDGAHVCLKFLHGRTDRRIFEQECRALLRLRHPSIISLLDFSGDETPPWLATEYAEGLTLENYLKQHGALDARTVVQILKPVLEALDYAHSQKVVHRDLKPANLIVDAQQNGLKVRILDFGVALVDQFDHSGRLTAEGSIPVGTVLYMAPEQLQGDLLTPACDLYGVGLIAWEMLMGQPAFQAKGVPALIQQKMMQTRGLALPGAADPRGLAGFIESSTHPDAGKRPSARAALEMLAATL